MTAGGVPERVVAGLRSAGATVAVAESLTGGQVSARLVAVPGCSAVFRGGVVAYATDLKASVLGVSAALLDERGPVDADVASQMARGVALRLGADHGVATTGVAGPAPVGDAPPGTAYVAAHGPGGTRVRQLLLAGPRGAVRAAVTAAALSLLGGLVADEAR